MDDTNPYAPPKAHIETQNTSGVIRENHELRALARKQLRGGWLVAAGVILVYNIMVSSVHYFDIFMGWVIPGFIVQFIVGGPATLGLAAFFLNTARGQQVKFVDFFEGFKNLGKSFLLYLLYAFFVMLWSLLLVIPGIVKMFSYSMAYFILKDNPEIGAMEAITRSKRMMNGYKGKLFFLYLSFIGWGLLCILSFGIGLLWLLPYMLQSMANFYEDVKYNAMPA